MSLAVLHEARAYVEAERPGAEIVESLLGILDEAKPRISRFAGMEIGESRFFPGVTSQNASTCARLYGRPRGMKFTVRKIATGGEIGIKVTRTA